MNRTDAQKAKNSLASKKSQACSHDKQQRVRVETGRIPQIRDMKAKGQAELLMLQNFIRDKHLQYVTVSMSQKEYSAEQADLVAEANEGSDIAIVRGIIRRGDWPWAHLGQMFVHVLLQSHPAKCATELLREVGNKDFPEDQLTEEQFCKSIGAKNPNAMLVEGEQDWTKIPCASVQEMLIRMGAHVATLREANPDARIIVHFDERPPVDARDVVDFSAPVIDGKMMHQSTYTLCPTDGTS